MNNIEDYLQKFEPERDQNEWVSENPSTYAKRMQERLLPNWPTEVLIEWFHRHAGHYNYAFLGFEKFQFKKERWDLKDIPGREVFADPTFFDNFQDIERRAEEPYDWLAKYMLKNGSWNTPIILLKNEKIIIAPSRLPLNTPYHLLEGHRRLSFLNGLRKINKAQKYHDIWVVTLRNNKTKLKY